MGDREIYLEGSRLNEKIARKCVVCLVTYFVPEWGKKCIFCHQKISLIKR